jgi:DNA processing protein
LIGALVGQIERAHRHPDRLTALLCAPDATLLALAKAAGRPELASAYEGFAAADAVEAARKTRLAPICRHHPSYPEALHELAAPPAVVHTLGSPERLAALLGQPVVAVVGARAASPYGREVAHALGRGLTAAGITVISGMATGIDSAAHAGALAVGGPTLTVLAGGADVPYPAAARQLHRRIVASGCAVSEAPPGLAPRRWSFVARNRLIAALARLTVVVEAGDRSGSLVTARIARELGREVAAVPGRATSRLSAGTNALIRDGAQLVRDAQDVLDLACGVGTRRAPARSWPSLRPGLRRLLAAVSDGIDTPGDLAATGIPVHEAMVGLAELELLGRVRRSLDGCYVAVA